MERLMLAAAVFSVISVLCNLVLLILLYRWRR